MDEKRMSHYKPYPAYKDSGGEWLGRVPEHWAVSPIKYLTTHIGSGKTPSGGSEVYQQSGVRFLRSQNIYEDGLRLEDVAYITESIDEEMKASRVKPLDVLLNITGASIGRSCQVPENFSNANVNQHVCIIRTHQADFSKWLSLCFPSQPVQSQIDLFQNGAGREGLNFEQIGNMVIGVPPREESGVIATNLDRETTRIDTLIAKKTRFIELLKEKRQALITQTVTKGLNPNVKMKDSGVEWLGKVPEHWRVTQIKRVVISISQGWSPECEPRCPEDDEWGVLKVGCVNGGVFRSTESKALPSNFPPRPELSINQGDVLVSRANTRDLVGSCAVAPTKFSKLMLCDKLYRLIADKEKVLPDFLAKLISVHGRRIVEIEATGASSSMVNIAQSVIMDLPISLPNADEQASILQYLKLNLKKLNSVLDKTDDSITLLKERRSALITAAVTGQIDLREAA